MSDTSAIFSGGSRFAADFQAVIDRAVAIASLPLAQMQSQRSTFDARAQAVGELSAKFETLQNTLEALGGATGATTFTSSVSNAEVLRATVSAGVRAASYSLEVNEIGSYATTLSAGAGVSDPATENLGSSGAFTLEIYEGNPAVLHESVVLTAETLDDLVTQINDSGLALQATLVNVGGSGAPEYRLSVQAQDLGELSFSLRDNAEPGVELLDPPQGGELAQYTINGTVLVTSSTRTVTLSPRLSVDLLAESAEAVTVTVDRTTTGLKSAISSVATAYNAALAELDKHRGEGTGALQGSGTAGELSNLLRDLAGYEGTGAYTALGGIYVEMKDDGTMSFDQGKFDEYVLDNLDDAILFLGNSDGGFVEASLGLMDSLLDDEAGMIDLESASLAAQIAAQDERIAVEEERIETLRESLVARMSAADALIAMLEQQVAYITDMFESMRVASSSLS